MNETLNKFFQKCNKLVLLTLCISISYSITQCRKNYVKIMVYSYFLTHESFMRIVRVQSKRTIQFLASSIALSTKTGMGQTEEHTCDCFECAVQLTSVSLCNSGDWSSSLYLATSFLLLREHRMSWLREFILIKFSIFARLFSPGLSGHLLLCQYC